MDLLPTLLTTLLLLGTPAAGYYLLESDAGGMVPAVEPAAAEPAAAEPAAPVEGVAAAAAAEGLLRLRVRHDGEALPAMLRITDADGAVVAEEHVELTGGAESAIEASVPRGAYAVAIEASNGATFLDSFSVSGSDGVDLAECPAGAAEFLLQTFDHASREGIVVPGSQCLPGPARHVAMQRVGAAVVAPFPLCPLDCTVGYSFLDEGALQFDVPEGASAIHVSAQWDPDVPKPQGIDVWLVRVDACGEGCNEGVVIEHTDGELQFEHAAPEPGRYGLAAHLAGPAGATVDEYVWLMARVVAP